MARIAAVAEDAEQAREKLVAQKKEEILLHFNRTGRKVKWRPDSVKGGRPPFSPLLEPTINGLRTAETHYQAALMAEGIKPSTED